MQKAVLTGEIFTQGDIAAAEGALAAGCRFFAGYPITPATEIAERMAYRLPRIGGRYIQMEDEIASCTAVVGASYSGVKSMTATSGPGISLMNETIGLAVMTETPMVLVNVMRGGPSTGQPTEASQSDIMQAKWGSHGDYEIIALIPSSVQEMFDLTIQAFNLSEQYRVPTFVLADEIIGHMRERLVIPPEDEIEIINRKKPTVPPEEYLPFKAEEDLIPPMAVFGEGYHFYATGLTHDERGYPVMDDETQLTLVPRLCDKIRRNTNKITQAESTETDDAETLVVAYGGEARTAMRAVKDARDDGMKIGLFRPITVWPFPKDQLKAAAANAQHVVVTELNYGQLVGEVERVIRNEIPVHLIPRVCGSPHTPDDLMKEIRRCIN
ncbi:MAG: 2-oxoacid:acceptor oxidoreductase subunit alpha [Candidatus Thorarchaeota archaeon]